MSREYRAKVFRSGNSLALRLPKALGVAEGSEMTLYGDSMKFTAERTLDLNRKIDLAGLYGSIPALVRMPSDEVERDWSMTQGNG